MQGAARALSLAVTCEWVGTEDIAACGASRLAGYDGLWVAPGSPFRSVDGALIAIRHARRAAVPLLGTCAGFRHIVLEFARNVLELRDAHSAEYDVPSPHRVGAPLSCSLVGQVLWVDVRSGSHAHRVYGATRVE